MVRSWTDEQKDAIYSTEGSVLVSAAAGSGKTAVLVERVIQMLTREQNPIDADKLLIVTFTRDAAAEMRARINLALSRLIEEEPLNPLYLRQKQLLYNASISTIDSFCGDIVREYFHTLSVSSDYRIADDGELALLSSSALDKSLESFYQSDRPDFPALLNAFSGKSGDKKLRDTVLKICEFLSTQPFKDQWMNNMLDSYSETDVTKSMWGRIIIEYAKESVSHALKLTSASVSLLDADIKLKEHMLHILDEDRLYISRLEEKLLNGNSWDDITEHVKSFSPSRLTAPRGYAEHPAKLQIAANRDEVKKVIKELTKYFCMSQRQVEEEFCNLRIIVAELFSLVDAYLEEFDALKRKKNVLSFSDVELLAVKLLAEPEGRDGYIKTPQAYEISSRYEAVIVDEFQDINDVQELLFNCVSRDRSNIFAVGDVKQSIYGFRQAKPRIFLEKRNSYFPYNRDNPLYPARIILGKNFRSRAEVCDTVNFIFTNLMTKQAAQMDYLPEDYLNVGASYPESLGKETEFVYIDKSNFSDSSRPELEAVYVADKIRRMMSEGFTVSDGASQRKATFGDFAILLRSTKSSAAVYVKTLNEFGIPAYADEKESVFESHETKLFINILRVIDNPAVDIPLLSVIMSPIYGFTADELAVIKGNSRSSSLINALKAYSLKEDSIAKKAKLFLDELAFFRNYSYTCTVDELIGKVLETTALVSVTSAVNGGETPTSRLNALRHYARVYESNGYKTLSDFICYIDRLIESGKDLQISSAGSGFGSNAVRVLSIHKSKGLEFPVCFIADTAHRFNKTDLVDDVLIDSKAGLGIRRKDGLRRYNTLPRLAVEIEISQNELAEEMRVLYVALTRAREKLIILSTVSDVSSYTENLRSKLLMGKFVEPYSVTRGKSYSEWLTQTVMINPNARWLDGTHDNIEGNTLYQNPPCCTVEVIEDVFSLLESSDSDKKEETAQEAPRLNYAALLKKNTGFLYPHSAISGLPQKVSASQIAHGDKEYFSKVIVKPSFLNETVVTATERGTAHHRFLQYCDFLRAREDINAEICRLKDCGRLSGKQCELIDPESLSRLVRNELFDRIIASNNVMREKRFTVKIKPSLVNDSFAQADGKAEIILQGEVDLAFEENGTIVVVDYKTDRVKDISVLADIYRKQLELYREAMRDVTGLKVSQCVICSVHLNQCIMI